MDKRTLPLSLAALLLAVLILTVTWFVQSRRTGLNDPEAVKWEGTLSGEDTGNTSGIRIPGYGSIIFPSEKLIVPLTLYNPQVNACYFQFVLYLENESSPLFTSGYIKPGYTLESAELSHALDTGVYTLRIQINTFDMDTLEPLNNAVVTASLTVV